MVLWGFFYVLLHMKAQPAVIPRDGATAYSLIPQTGGARY